MATVIPFKALRPSPDKAHRVSVSMELDDKEESLQEMKRNPNSFLHIVRPYLHFDDPVKIPEKHFPFGKVYLNRLIDDGVLKRDENASFYLYRAIKGHLAYTGIIGAAAIDDYLNGVILKHENTRTEKQESLATHLSYIGNLGSPVVVGYPDDPVIENLLENIIQRKPVYGFITTDQVKHNLWVVDDPHEVELVAERFQDLKKLYIADGHHRSAGAAYYCQKKRLENPNFSGQEAFNYFPVCAVPFSKLTIYEYHRLVKDPAMPHPELIIKSLKKWFNIHAVGDLPFVPLKKWEIGIYISGHAWQLELKSEFRNEDPLGSLDVTIAEKYILQDTLRITDSKTDPRLTFMDGSKGIGHLQDHVDQGKSNIAITLYPTAIEELTRVADDGLIMPPKSTWIEPKMRTGLVIYEMDSK